MTELVRHHAAQLILRRRSRPARRPGTRDVRPCRSRRSHDEARPRERAPPARRRRSENLVATGSNPKRNRNRREQIESPGAPGRCGRLRLADETSSVSLSLFLLLSHFLRSLDFMPASATGACAARRRGGGRDNLWGHKKAGAETMISMTLCLRTAPPSFALVALVFAASCQEPSSGGGADAASRAARNGEPARREQRGRSYGIPGRRGSRGVRPGGVTAAAARRAATRR